MKQDSTSDSSLKNRREFRTSLTEDSVMLLYKDVIDVITLLRDEAKAKYNMSMQDSTPASSHAVAYRAYTTVLFLIKDLEKRRCGKKCASK
jgi:hypothetical protein